MANPNRPLSIAAYPIFYGLPGTDPDMHVSRFLAVCAANRVLNQDYLRTFPATLDGAAFSWYQRQPDFADWDALRNAFIAQYRPSFPTNRPQKAVFVKLRQNVDFETGFHTITAILDVELVISRKHTKYFALTDALKLEEMLAFH
jgi:hypothetical protein